MAGFESVEPTGHRQPVRSCGLEDHSELGDLRQPSPESLKPCLRHRETLASRSHLQIAALRRSPALRCRCQSRWWVPWSPPRVSVHWEGQEVGAYLAHTGSCGLRYGPASAGALIYSLRLYGRRAGTASHPRCLLTPRALHVRGLSLSEEIKIQGEGLAPRHLRAPARDAPTSRGHSMLVVHGRSISEDLGGGSQALCDHFRHASVARRGVSEPREWFGNIE